MVIRALYSGGAGILIWGRVPGREERDIVKVRKSIFKGGCAYNCNAVAMTAEDAEERFGLRRRVSQAIT